MDRNVVILASLILFLLILTSFNIWGQYVIFLTLMIILNFTVDSIKQICSKNFWTIIYISYFVFAYKLPAC